MTESFEAKKHAYRQTQDGIVISFTIHPNDMPEHLAIAPLGTRFGVAVAEIGDDERPITAQGTPRVDGQSDRASAPDAAEVVGSSPIPVATKDRRPFASLPLSQQAALRCRDPQFVAFLKYEWPDEWSDSKDAAQTVRDLCKCKSRSELDNPDSFQAQGWIDLEVGFQTYLTDQRYAGAVR